jgi:hypothetical protein
VGGSSKSTNIIEIMSIVFFLLNFLASTNNGRVFIKTVDHRGSSLCFYET